MTEYKQLRRQGKDVPFGYREDPDSPKVLIPIPEHLEILKLAEQYLKNGSSYKAVSQWVTQASGVYLSDVGLWKRIRNINYTDARITSPTPAKEAETAQSN